MRKFEWVPGYETSELLLPMRQTPGSAGYDLFAYDRCVVAKGAVQLIQTGVRVLLENGEFLAIFARSSLAVKHYLILANGVGVVDADYYGNADNFGHIMIPLVNLGQHDVIIERGERIAQGIFMPFMTIQNESFVKRLRTGGFGSTDT